MKNDNLLKLKEKFNIFFNIFFLDTINILYYIVFQID
jgi:hypothetical protein